jgi:hypothetical protein
MQLYDLYHHCFTDEDKRHLAYLLKKEKVTASNELLLEDWLNITECSVRLKNLLGYISRNHNVSPSQVTKEMFLNLRGAGVKTWEEFTDLRGDNI